MAFVLDASAEDGQPLRCPRLQLRGDRLPGLLLATRYQGLGKGMGTFRLPGKGLQGAALRPNQKRWFPVSGQGAWFQFVPNDAKKICKHGSIPRV